VTSEPSSRFLTVREAAAHLGHHRMTVRYWIAKNRLNALFLLDGGVRISEAALIRFSTALRG